MNDLIRPSLYDAHHQLVPVYEDLDDDEAEQKTWDIVGPICETGDFLAKNRALNLQEGDTLGNNLTDSEAIHKQCPASRESGLIIWSKSLLTLVVILSLGENCGYYEPML